MNNKQRSYIIFLLCLIKPDLVHVRANFWFYVGFVKAKSAGSIIRYSNLSRKFKIIDNHLAHLKQKFKDFGLTWFWEFKTKMCTTLGLLLIGFMMKYSEICYIICQQYQEEEHLNIKIKIQWKVSQFF